MERMNRRVPVTLVLGAMLLVVTGVNDERAADDEGQRAPVTHNGKTRNLRWAILAVMHETARHAGHADIIREQIDGQTGR